MEAANFDGDDNFHRVPEERQKDSFCSKFFCRKKNLETVGTWISKVGTACAILIVHILLLWYFLGGLLKREIDLFGGESD